MASPLEYLILMMMTAQPQGPANLASIEPSSGAPITSETMMIEENGTITMRTILMEPRDASDEHLEAPVRILPEWLPSFKIGMPLTITIDENKKTYPAKVSRIESILDETGSTIQVIATIDSGTDTLEPGMVGTAIAETALTY